MVLNFYWYIRLTTMLCGVLMLGLSILYAFPLSRHPLPPGDFTVLLLLLPPAGIIMGYAQLAARIGDIGQVGRLEKAGFVGALTGFVLVLIAVFGNRFWLSIAGQHNLTLAYLGSLVSLGSVFLFGILVPRILSWRELPYRRKVSIILRSLFFIVLVVLLGKFFFNLVAFLFLVLAIHFLEILSRIGIPVNLFVSGIAAILGAYTTWRGYLLWSGRDQ